MCVGFSLVTNGLSITPEHANMGALQVLAFRHGIEVVVCFERSWPAEWRDCGRVEKSLYGCGQIVHLLRDSQG